MDKMIRETPLRQHLSKNWKAVNMLSMTVVGKNTFIRGNSKLELFLVISDRAKKTLGHGQGK